MNVGLCLSFLPVLGKSPPTKRVIGPNLLQKANGSLGLGMFQIGEFGLELVFSGHIICKEVVKYNHSCDVIDVVYFLTIIGRKGVFDSLAKLAQLGLGTSD